MNAKHTSSGTLLGSRFADGMGLGMKLCWTGGVAGAFDCSDGTGKQRQNQSGSAMPAGTRAMQWGNNSPIEG